VYVVVVVGKHHDVYMMCVCERKVSDDGYVSRGGGRRGRIICVYEKIKKSIVFISFNNDKLDMNLLKNINTSSQ
jgi:hypothetical protein